MFPEIDSQNWTKRRPLFSFMIIGLPVLLVVLILVGMIAKRWRPIYQHLYENEMAYAPLDEGTYGFIGKTNELMAYLLAQCDSSVVATDLQSLNRRYPALTFDLPYPSVSGSLVMTQEESDHYRAIHSLYAEDLRLVGICVDSIKDRRLKSYYINSRIPGLLVQQKDNLAEKLFRIKSRTYKGNVHSSRKTTIEVTDIDVIASQFRVALRKDPWAGMLISTSDCLFDSKEYLYVVAGNTILPLRRVNELFASNLMIDIDLPNYIVKYDGGAIDYYHYRREASSRSGLVLNLKSGERTSNQITINAVESPDSLSIYIRSNSRIAYQVYRPNHGSQYFKTNDNASVLPNSIAFEDGMKVVVIAHPGESEESKLAEFSIVSHNPMWVLSSLLQTNSGKYRYCISSDNTDLFTQQLVRGLSRHLTNESCPIDTVRVTVDPMLSREFEHEIRQYLQTIRRRFGTRDQYEMSITIMDMATGHIIATPFVSDEIDALPKDLRVTRKNPALVRRYIGSTFKPLLSLAAVLNNHSLLQLNTRTHHPFQSLGGYGMFYGMRTDLWAASMWSREHNMSSFLGYSDDVYPVALAALCLAGFPDQMDLSNVASLRSQCGNPTSAFARSRESMVFSTPTAYGDITGTELLCNIDRLYGVISDYVEDQSLINRNSLWKNVYFRRNNQDRTGDGLFALDEITPECTQMYYHQWIEESMSLRGGLVPWVLGQGNNAWNCISLAQAWTRMITKQPIDAVFVTPGASSYYFTPSPSLVHQIRDSVKVGRGFDPQDTYQQIDRTWNGFLDALSAAQSMTGRSATLRPMYDAVSRLNRTQNLSEGQQLHLFSKTGTPDNYSFIELQTFGSKTRYLDLGLYVFSLVSQQSFNNVKEHGAEDGYQTSGITCVIRLTRTTNRRPQGNGIQSMDARDFFSASDRRLNKLYQMTKKYY